MLTSTVLRLSSLYLAIVSPAFSDLPQGGSKVVMRFTTSRGAKQANAENMTRVR